MNFLYNPILAINWPVFVFWWCAACLIFGVWLGWLLWRHSDRDARYLEMENRKAQKDYEKREKTFASNQELIESMLDPNTES